MGEPGLSGAAAEPLGGLDDHRPDWERLAERSGNLFATWDWADCWWRHLARGRRPALTGVRGADGELACILPLYVATSAPARSLRFIGHGRADQLGPVCGPEHLPAARTALAHTLERDPGLDLFIADDAPAAAELRELPGAQALCRTASPLVRIDGRGFEELLAERSRNFRQQVRARGRRLARGRRVTIRLTTEPAQVEPDVTTLIALHTLRWNGSGGSAAYTGARRAFHLEFARRALARGWLRLWTLELDGSPAAALHGFRFGGSEWYYQAGRDPAYEREAVGFVLLAHAVREAAADGVARYRLLRGDESYKSRFADADEPVETVAVARSRAGRALLAAVRGASRLPRPARRRLPETMVACLGGARPPERSAA